MCWTKCSIFGKRKSADLYLCVYVLNLQWIGAQLVKMNSIWNYVNATQRNTNCSGSFALKSILRPIVLFTQYALNISSTSHIIMIFIWWFVWLLKAFCHFSYFFIVHDDEDISFWSFVYFLWHIIVYFFPFIYLF